MPNMTIVIPEDLKKRMDAVRTVNWSGVARKAFEEQLDVQRRVELIWKLKGTAKLRTPAEQKRAERELMEMSSLDLFREFGLDKPSEVRFVSRDDEVAFRSKRKRSVQSIRPVRRKRRS